MYNFSFLLASMFHLETNPIIAECKSQEVHMKSVFSFLSHFINVICMDDKKYSDDADVKKDKKIKD